MHWGGWHIWCITMLTLVHGCCCHVDIVWSETRQIARQIMHVGCCDNIALINTIHIKSASMRVHQVVILVILGHFYGIGRWVVDLSWVVHATHAWNVVSHHLVRVHQVAVVHPCTWSLGVVRLNIHGRVMTVWNGIHSYGRTPKHTMSWTSMCIRWRSSPMSCTAWIGIIKSNFP